MVPAGNKVKRLSSVNHTTKIIHHQRNLFLLKPLTIWKFVQRHFIASKLKAGCGGYLDQIYRILLDILDLRFFHTKQLFVRKQWKIGLDPTFFLLQKNANQWEFSKKSLRTKKIRWWKTGLISHANGSKVVYLSVDPNADHFKGRFPLKSLEARKLLTNPSHFVIVGITNTKLFVVKTVYFLRLYILSTYFQLCFI